MKKIYMKNSGILRLAALTGICLFSALAPRIALGQTYYSTFPDNTGKYSVTEPSGGTCNAPEVKDAAYLADNDPGTYAYFKGKIAAELTCTDKNYSFKTYLNLPADSASIEGGPQAGFRIKVPGTISSTALSDYLTIRTYLDNTSAETFSGSDVYPVDLSSDGTKFFVYVNTTKRFNRLELLVNDKIIPVNTPFEFDVFYGFASVAGLFPVTINNFKVAPSGKNVTVSWQSLNEVNISSYRIERSSNGGAAYTTVALLPARGGSAAITYSYTDKILLNGSYLYRVVATDKDGASKTTNSLSATIKGKEIILVMPSIVKAGQTVVINGTANSLAKLFVFDVQGRTIRQQNVAIGEKATINTAGLSAGTYIIKIVTASGSISQNKFIVD